MRKMTTWQTLKISCGPEKNHEHGHIWPESLQFDLHGEARPFCGSQRVTGDDVSGGESVTAARREEGGLRYHLHAHLPPGCGVHVGLRPHRSRSQRGVRWFQRRRPGRANTRRWDLHNIPLFSINSGANSTAGCCVIYSILTLVTYYVFLLSTVRE